MAMQAVRTLFMLWALKRHDDGNFPNFLPHHDLARRRLPFWIAGALAEGRRGSRCGRSPSAIELIAADVGFRVPGIGRSTTTDWVVEGGHMAERCALFIIIALGESVLITGATFAGLTWTAPHVGAFLVAFVGSVAMWAVYFNIGAERGSRQIATSGDPGGWRATATPTFIS